MRRGGGEKEGGQRKREGKEEGEEEGCQVTRVEQEQWGQKHNSLVLGSPGGPFTPPLLSGSAGQED